MLLEELRKNETIYAYKSSDEAGVYKTSYRQFPRLIIALLVICLSVIIAFLIILLLFMNTSPCGRKRVINSSLEADIEEGRDLSNHLLSKYNANNQIVPNNSDLSKHFKTITTNVIVGAINSGAEQLNNIEWRIFLIHSSLPSAFVFPNGDIFVTTGLFPIVETEEGLAFVIAHEIAHVYSRHGAEEKSKYHFLRRFGDVMSIVLPFVGQMITSKIESKLNQFLVTKEIEADLLALLFLAHTNFDPRAAIPVADRLSALEDPKVNHFPQRKKLIGDYMNEAVSMYNHNHPLPLPLRASFKPLPFRNLPPYPPEVA